MLDASESLPPGAAPLVDPAELPRWVLHDDERLLVIDKPGWLVVHPSKNGPWSSLGGAVKEGLGIGTVRLVNRLDRETSGVVLIAKDEATGSRLQKAMGRRRIAKCYVAVLHGELGAVTRVEQALGPDPTTRVTVKQRVLPADGPGAQECVSVFHPLAVRNGHTLAGIELLTGRKHQIRAHAQWLGMPVVGDKLYGPDPELYIEFAEQGWTARHTAMLGMTRQALHCVAIDLRPARMDHLFRAPWPRDMARYARRAMELSETEAQALLDRFVESVMPGSVRGGSVGKY
jgi:23S rRNA pseudouridine1911/1915/1917 synthase